MFVTGNTEIKFCFSSVIGFQYILSYYIYGVVETDKMIDMIKVFYDFVPGFVFKKDIKVSILIFDIFSDDLKIVIRNTFYKIIYLLSLIFFTSILIIMFHALLYTFGTPRNDWQIVGDLFKLITNQHF